MVDDFSPGWAEVENTWGTHLENPSKWDDLTFPAQAINPLGSAAPPAIDTNLAEFPGTLLFSGSAVNIIAGVAQMHHTWEEGTAIHPHIHWMKTSVDASDLAVGWQFKWRKSSVTGIWTDWSAWQDAVLIAGSNTQLRHTLSIFPLIDMTGDTVSAMIAWQLQRTGDTDAYNAQARLFEFDIHYRKDSFGSALEYSK